MYFNLNNNCHFVRGRSNGIIYNLTIPEMIELSSAESDAIVHSMSNEIRPHDYPFFHELEKMGCGFMSEKRYFIDRIRSINKITLMRPDIYPLNFNIAFLQLTWKCSGNEQECLKHFCAPCRTRKCSTDMAVEQWKGIIDRLHDSAVNGIILTGGDVTMYEGLSELSSYIRKKEIPLSIVLNQYAQNLEKIDKSIPVCIFSCGQTDVKALVTKFSAFSNMTLIHNSPIQMEQKELFAKHSILTVYAPSEMTITKSSLQPCTVDSFFQRRYFESCLSGKMYINADGNVVPCFQVMEKHIGNVLRQDFSEIHQKLISDYWMKPHRHHKCISCERYYGCPVCSFMNPDKVCSYIP